MDLIGSPTGDISTNIGGGKGGPILSALLNVYTDDIFRLSNANVCLGTSLQNNIFIRRQQ